MKAQTPLANLVKTEEIFESVRWSHLGSDSKIERPARETAFPTDLPALAIANLVRFGHPLGPLGTVSFLSELRALYAPLPFA